MIAKGNICWAQLGVGAPCRVMRLVSRSFTVIPMIIKYKDSCVRWRWKMSIGFSRSTAKDQLSMQLTLHLLTPKQYKSLVEVALSVLFYVLWPSWCTSKKSVSRASRFERPGTYGKITPDVNFERFDILVETHCIYIWSFVSSVNSMRNSCSTASASVEYLTLEKQVLQSLGCRLECKGTNVI